MAALFASLLFYPHCQPHFSFLLKPGDGCLKAALTILHLYDSTAPNEDANLWPGVRGRCCVVMRETFCWAKAMQCDGHMRPVFGASRAQKARQSQP
jgi:hypothetical protein